MIPVCNYETVKGFDNFRDFSFKTDRSLTDLTSFPIDIFNYEFSKGKVSDFNETIFLVQIVDLKFREIKDKIFYLVKYYVAL